jgi:hypothetical protein
MGQVIRDTSADDGMTQLKISTSCARYYRRVVRHRNTISVRNLICQYYRLFNLKQL